MIHPTGTGMNFMRKFLIMACKKQQREKNIIKTMKLI